MNFPDYGEDPYQGRYEPFDHEGLTYERTTWAMPEQYLVKLGSLDVAYLRLRWSNFTVQCPDLDGELVLAEIVEEEAYTGRFWSPETRTHWLGMAHDAIVAWLRRKVDTLPQKTREGLAGRVVGPVEDPVVL